jgi:PPOX class probable FMN-dependent enzyme
MAQIATLDRLLQLVPDPGPKASAKILDRLDEQALAFVQRSPFVVMATDGEAGLELSPKGDDPGFVEILDPRTLLIPERNGNQLTLGLRNILANGRIGLMLFRPATEEVLRISGRARLLDDQDVCERLATRGKPAVLAIKVDIQRAFFHCPRSIKRAGLWQPESWDQPTRISMGKIIAQALGRPELQGAIDEISDQRNEELWI